jgi:hypothetical protein
MWIFRALDFAATTDIPSTRSAKELFDGNRAENAVQVAAAAGRCAAI